MCPDPRRIIPAHGVDPDRMGAFPYFEAIFTPPLAIVDEDDDERPIAEGLSTPAEDAERLISVDQIIHEKLQMAEQQAQGIAQHAFEEGFAAGETEGRAFGESQYKAYLQRLEGHLGELSDLSARFAHAIEEEALALALAVGEYLAAQQIEHASEAMRPLVERILENSPFPTTGVMDVFLNPKDLEQLKTEGTDYPGLRLLEDENLSRGSLRAVAAEGVLEATLERRRDRLMEAIQRRREEERA
ncbi:MAG: hypothetical protein LWX11_10650 [Firmicutes bacterium]|nr:hypothetical protein [Bacillota bacterium]